MKSPQRDDDGEYSMVCCRPLLKQALNRARLLPMSERLPYLRRSQSYEILGRCPFKTSSVFIRRASYDHTSETRHLARPTRECSIRRSSSICFRRSAYVRSW